ncbi:uncharacterized protein LOC124197276 isoform X1 [Daphnia pulex]|uniref:uncharacterized protein LOC124197276 isoform X1 n=1 Tax=Daphnia pulex TaxID=6669 RepID=UPI001EDFD857|nr:uncharacterized protein LOC124197276 isoform X1 [Daphnia pulex]
MLTNTLHLLLLIVATLWTANGKPAEPSESVISGRESRQLFMLPYHGQWVEPPQHHSNFQHDYYYDGLMNTMGPATQQRLMEALLAVSQRKHPMLQESGFDPHLNQFMSPAPSYSKNQDGNAAGHSATQQHEFIQLQPRPDIQAFVNQTIQTVIQAVVQAILAQMMG